MTVRFKVDRRSLGQALKAFDEFPRAVRNRHVRIAMSAMAGVQRSAARKFAPRETGLLRKSLAIKVRVPDASKDKKHHGRPAYSVVGADKNAVRASIKNKRGQTKLLSDKNALKRVLSGGKVEVRKPARYAHLAERKGKSPSLFMTKASITSQRAAIFVAKKKLSEGAVLEARKIAAKAAQAARPVENISIREVSR